MKKQYILGIISLFLLSCDSEIRIKMETTPSKIVVNASITPEKEISAHVSRSWSIMDATPDMELSQATVVVYVNDQYQGEMVPMDKSDSSEEIKGYYVLPNSTIRSEDKIAFQVESPGYESVSSEVVIPLSADVISIDTVNVSSENQSKIQIYIRLNDKDLERNYYRLIIEKESVFQQEDSLIITKTYAYSLNEKEPNYYTFENYFSDYSGFKEAFYIEYDDLIFRPPGSSPLPGQSESYSCWGTFPDDLFNGQEHTVRCIISGDAMYSFEDSALSHTVYYNIQLLSISESYYQYMKSTWLFMLENWDLEGLREPFPTYTNVQNGYGVVSAYQVVSKKITMPKQDKPPGRTPFDKYAW